jgi:hypothetical protein
MHMQGRAWTSICWRFSFNVNAKIVAAQGQPGKVGHAEEPLFLWPMWAVKLLSPPAHQLACQPTQEVSAEPARA